MTTRNVDDLPHAPWGVAAAYLYTLDLNGSALAWEYLRRNAGYRAEYERFRRRRVAWAERWGLRCCRRPTTGCARGTSALALVP